MYSCHLFLISSASLRSLLFLSFIVPIFAWNVPLVSLVFLKRSLVFPQSIVFLYFFALFTEKGFLIPPCYSFSSAQSLSRVQLFVTPWNAAHQASLSITNSWSLLKLVSIEAVMPSNHLILCRPLFLSPSIIPSIRVFSNESVLRIRWPKYWSFSFSISPSNENVSNSSF